MEHDMVPPSLNSIHLECSRSFRKSRIFTSLPIEYSLDYFNYCQYISNIFQIFQNWLEKYPRVYPGKSKESSNEEV